MLTVVLGVLVVASMFLRGADDAGGGGAGAPAAVTGAGTVSPSPAPVTAGGGVEPDPVPQTSDATAFARAVALALFEWDTTSGFEPGDYRGRLLVLADPTGKESPGLVADLTTYLPDAKVWAHLSRYSTRQWIEVTDVAVPGQWHEALAQAAAGTIAAGTTALTVTGVRHRAGVWDGKPVTSAHDVAFTLFVVCQPTYPTCHLLRISQLDNPLR